MHKYEKLIENIQVMKFSRKQLDTTLKHFFSFNMIKICLTNKLKYRSNAIYSLDIFMKPCLRVSRN